MSMRILTMIIFFSIIGIISDFIHLYIQKREAKKYNYNCSKCGVWTCPYKTCKKYMGERS